MVETTVEVQHMTTTTAVNQYKVSVKRFYDPATGLVKIEVEATPALVTLLTPYICKDEPKIATSWPADLPASEQGRWAGRYVERYPIKSAAASALRNQSAMSGLNELFFTPEFCRANKVTVDTNGAGTRNLDQDMQRIKTMIEIVESLGHDEKFTATINVQQVTR
jgi:hypothetical protein